MSGAARARATAAHGGTPPSALQQVLLRLERMDLAVSEMARACAG